MALALLLLPFAARMRKFARQWKGRAWTMVFVLAGVVLAAGLTACGGGSGGMSGGGGGTPQTYTLNITATSGSLSQTTTTGLTVQ
jgi:ABC-type Fe3+ transport system permease subunit